MPPARPPKGRHDAWVNRHGGHTSGNIPAHRLKVQRGASIRTLNHRKEGSTPARESSLAAKSYYVKPQSKLADTSAHFFCSRLLPCTRRHSERALRRL